MPSYAGDKALDEVDDKLADVRHGKTEHVRRTDQCSSQDQLTLQSFLQSKQPVRPELNGGERPEGDDE